MVFGLSSKLVKLHKNLVSAPKINGHQDLSLAMSTINQHIFNYLRAEGRPLRTYSIGNLPLSTSTLIYTGRDLSRFFSRSFAIRYVRIDLTRYFEGRVNPQALNHVRLANIVQVINDLHVPLEYALYGTLDNRQIALYNYTYYDTLNKFNAGYLTAQLRSYQRIAKLFNTVHYNEHLSFMQIADKLGMSRQNVSYYLHGRNAVFSKRDTFVRLCLLACKNPIIQLYFPLLDRQFYVRTINEYIQQRKASWKNKNIWKGKINVKISSHKKDKE